MTPAETRWAMPKVFFQQQSNRTLLKEDGPKRQKKYKTKNFKAPEKKKTMSDGTESSTLIERDAFCQYSQSIDAK